MTALTVLTGKTDRKVAGQPEPAYHGDTNFALREVSSVEPASLP